MEAGELELINRLTPSNAELRYLVQRHQGFEKELTRLERIRFPSEAERREIKLLKRMKLRGKDRMKEILAKHA